MITVIHDPAGIIQRSNYEHGDVKLLDWLIKHYGSNGFSVPTEVFINNVSVDLGEFITTGCPIKADDSVAIIHRPQGIDPFTIFVISFVVSTVVALALVPTPSIPEVNTPTESPNNKLTGQTNIARPLQRIPDIYGTNKVFPDLIAPTYFEFVNHVKIQNEYMCIGRGEFLIEEEKTGGTLLSDIDGTTSTIYEPFNIPVNLLNVRESNEINGQEVVGPNIRTVDINSVSVEFTANNQFKGTNPILANFLNLSDGDSLTISTPNSVSVTGSSDIDFTASSIKSDTDLFQDFQAGEYITISGTSSNNGNAIINTVTGLDLITALDSVTGATKSFTVENNTSASINNTIPNGGTFTFDSVSTVDLGGGVTEYTITVDETTFTTPLFSHLNKFLSSSFASNELGPFNVPGNPEQVWFDIQMPRGLQDSGGYYRVTLTLRLQEIDSGGSPIGSPEDQVIVLEDNTTDPRFYTFKVTPANPGGLYQASIIRATNNASSSSIFDQTKWTRLAGVENVTATDFGDVTTWFVTTRATEQATSVQERKFNCIATRKLPTYDSGTGAMTTTTAATAKVADAVVHMITDSKMGNKPSSQIDLAGLYAIQDSLDSDAIYGDSLGRFCYSFSNSRTTVNDELNTALKACRMFRYQEGNIIKFGRDQANSVRTTLFNRRVKKPDGETKTVNLFKPNDFDGIELEWIDERTGEGNTINFPEGSTANNPQKIEAAGVKNYQQAWNLAAIEYNKLLYRRTSVKTSVLRDGLLVFPNARVASVDSTTLQTQDGEITGFSGTTVATSNPVDFEGNASATVILRDESGTPSSPITVTPRLDGVDGFILSSGFDIKLRGESNYQVGTLYDFSPDSNHTANDYLVQSISPGNDGYVDLELINYSDALFTPDTTTPTAES